MAVDMITDDCKDALEDKERGSIHRLVRVVPPREGDFNLQSFMNTLESLDFVDEVISFEIAVKRGDVQMFVRSERVDNILTALHSHYPEMRFEAVSGRDEDPLYVRTETENAWRQAIWPAGDEFLPFQVYDETGLLEYRSDPFIGMIGGLSNEMRPGARLVSRLLLSQKSHDWSESWRGRAMKGAGGENQTAVEALRQSDRADRPAQSAGKSQQMEMEMQPIYIGLALAALVIIGYLAQRFLLPELAGWSMTEITITLTVAFAVIAALFGGVYLGLRRLGFFKPKPPPQFYDPDLVKLRVEGAAFRMEVQVFGIVSEDSPENESVQGLLRPAVAAYQSFDNPLGNRFGTGTIDRLDGFDPASEELGYLGGANKKSSVGEGVVGTREAAAFWHVPGSSAKTPSLARAGSVRLDTPEPLFDPSDTDRMLASLVGREIYADGGERLVYLPEDVMRRHHMYVARTRMGKSTLMLHNTLSLLLQKVGGLSSASMVVVDPHSDLVNDVIERMPLEILDEIRLIDMSDRERACGINLLDVHAFPERDLTIPTIIAIARSSSVNWGDRMEAIMNWTFTALYEANKRRKPAEQYTIFDAVPFLTDHDAREDIIQESLNVDVAEWWNEIYPTLVPKDDQTALAPVLRKIGEYAASRSARRVLGQRQCTLALDEVIDEGKALLVNTARGETGPEVAAIIGSSILNLTEFIVRQQSGKPAGERRRVIVIVDEMQTLSGVRFDDMLAELGKFGGNLIMATQSLSRLSEMSESGAMLDSILSNLGCLLVFQVNAADADLLVRELDSASLTEDDILRLPPHHCYGRANLADGANYFSMETLPPGPGMADMLRLARQASEEYTTPSEVIDAQHARYMDDKFRQYFVDNRPADYGQGDYGRNGITKHSDGSVPVAEDAAEVAAAEDFRQDDADA